MQTENVKLNDIASIMIGLPIQRYTEKEELIEQNIITNKSIEEIDDKFEIEEEILAKDIKKQFFSKEHDILYKVQQQSFAKEITTETDAIIPNTYIIIRADEKKVNPTFLTNYLNDPRIDYEIQRQIDSTRIMKVNTGILKNLTIKLPDKEYQDKYAKLIEKIQQRINLKKQSIENDERLINSLYDTIIGDRYAK